MSYSHQYSFDPRLRAHHAAAYFEGQGHHPANVQQVPYPTREQHMRTETQYREALTRYNAGETTDKDGKPLPVPVRQPPTMISAMQRPDLTPEARRSMLQKLQPHIPTLEKKYRVIFSSDARRTPQHTSTNDFTVDVTSDTLPVKVNGFELIGYSLPQTEWAIEPYENAIPMRYGWNAHPGSRMWSVVSKSVDPNGPVIPDQQVFTGPVVALVCELPLVRNPIVRIRKQDGKVYVTCARRLGTSFLSIPGNIIIDDAGYGHATGSFPGRYLLNRAQAEQDHVDTYMDASSAPATEARLAVREAFGSNGVDHENDPAYTFAVSDPVFAGYFIEGTEARVYDNSPYNSLGSVYTQPPASMRELVDQVNAQLSALVASRQAWEDEVGARHTVPIHSIRVAAASVGSTYRLRVDVNWMFHRVKARSADDKNPMDIDAYVQRLVHGGTEPEAVAAQVCPIHCTLSDGLGARFGLPQLGQVRYDHMTPHSATATSMNPPILYPDDTVDIPPVADASAIEPFFQAINTTVSSLRFTASNPSALAADSEFRGYFVIPIAFGDEVVNVKVEEGEYRPWSLAAMITEAIRESAILRPLRIVVSPSFLDHTGNAIAGFRFTSVATQPQPFGLAFDTATSNPAAINPARLGFRPLRYQGQTLYDPKLLSVMDDPYAGMSAPISFPATELGNGVPSPLPAVPYMLPAFNNKRLQVMQIAHDAAPVESTLPPYPLSAVAFPEAHNVVPITLQKPTLFYHMQPVNIKVTFDPTSLLFNSVFGVSEASGTNSSTEWLMTSGDERLDANLLLLPSAMTGGGTSAEDMFGLLDTRTRDATSSGDIKTLLAAIHSPLQASGLAEAMITLFGSQGTVYAAGVAPASVTGLYRTEAITRSMSSAAIIDSHLRNIAAGTHVRSSLTALVHVMIAVAKVTDVLITGGLAEAIDKIVDAYKDAESVPEFTRDFLTDLVNSYMWRSIAVETTQLLDSNSVVPQTIRPNRLYFYPFEGTLDATAGASDPLDMAHLHLHQISPTLAVFYVEASAASGNFQISHTSGTGGSPFQFVPFVIDALGDVISGQPHTHLLAGRRYVLHVANHGADISGYDIIDGASPPLQGPDGSWDAASKTFSFLVPHNAAGTLRIYWTGNATAVNISSIADNTETEVAKMYAIANNYTVTIPGFAYVDLRGTNAHPFNIDAALSDLGQQTPVTQEQAVEELLDRNDPGILHHQVVHVVPATSSWGVLPPDLGVSVNSTLMNTKTLWYELLNLARGTANTSMSVTRLNEYPLSVDFLSHTTRRIRPERMGFIEDEYTADLNRVPVPDNGRWLHPASIGSVIDIERGGPPYVLLGIQINGMPSPSPVTQRPDGIDTEDMQAIEGARKSSLADSGAIISIGNSNDARQDRQVIHATAYVHLGTDGTTLKMLDRQDDRTPTLLPTSTYVNSVRFVVMRPDGTLYNFHGRRTMVALKFISHPDNPSFMVEKS